MNTLSHRNFPTRLTKQENTLNFMTHVKRGKYNSLAKLYDGLRSSVWSINHLFSCHLITYPNISIMIECGDAELLNANTEKLKEVIESQLWEYVGC